MIGNAERNNKLFSGEWIFSECERMAYKLDKQGTLLFNCVEEVSQEEKVEFSITALINMGVEESKAREMIKTTGPMQ